MPTSTRATAAILFATLAASGCQTTRTTPAVGTPAMADAASLHPDGGNDLPNRTRIPDASHGPWRSVVLVEPHFANGTRSTGTGVIIGDHEVITAAHVIYDRKAGRATRIVVYPARIGRDAPFGSYDAVAVSYEPVKTDSLHRMNEEQSLDDIALLSFREPIGTTVGRMDIDPHFTSGPVNVTGYPVKHGRNMMSNVTGTVVLSNEHLAIGDLGTSPGDSGGPIWRETPEGARLVGIVSTTTWGVPLSIRRLAQVTRWAEANSKLLASAVR